MVPHKHRWGSRKVTSAYFACAETILFCSLIWFPNTYKQFVIKCLYTTNSKRRTEPHVLIMVSSYSSSLNNIYTLQFYPLSHCWVMGFQTLYVVWHCLPQCSNPGLPQWSSIWMSNQDRPCLASEICWDRGSLCQPGQGTEIVDNGI